MPKLAKILNLQNFHVTKISCSTVPFSHGHEVYDGSTQMLMAWKQICDRSQGPFSKCRRTARLHGLTTLHCAPSWSELVMNMQNHLVSTKLHCAPPKCMSVQNYIVNIDLHVLCETMRPCLCAPLLMDIA